MTDHERQGTGYGPDARGHELQGRATDPKILVRRALLAEHERQVRENPPCPRCGRPRSNVTIAGAPGSTRSSGRVVAPLEAPVEVCRCWVPTRYPTAEEVAEGRRTDSLPRPAQTIAGVDLATGPDVSRFTCGLCGFTSSDAETMVSHKCPPQ